VIDRFRSLPIWRASVLIGRSLSDLLAAALCVSIVAVTGLAIGWRTSASVMSVLGAFAVVLLFSYSLGWMCACIGLVSNGPESAQGVGLIVLFPIAIVSNAMVPTQGMPPWLRTIADWNPVSSVTSAVRNLFGNPNPSATIRSWPMEHPIWAALMWSVVILAVCAPLAVHLFRRRTTE
jgi:ABC-2 type transport system permease protein